jgi:hypothetical protein
LQPEVLGNAIAAYVWDERSAIPGRHPDRVPDPELLVQVEAVINRLDAIQPDKTARDLMGWAERQASALADYDGLSAQGVRALRDLLSWTWR